jgi:hypothetical protein
MNKISWAGAVIGCVALARVSSAVTWVGFSTILPGTSLALRPELAGTIVADQTLETFGTAQERVLVRNWVVRETATGTLDFYFQFSNPNQSNVTIATSAITGFDLGPSLDVDFRRDIGKQDLFFASRAEATVFSPPTLYVGDATRGRGAWTLLPGEALAPFFVHTDATAFGTAGTLGTVAFDNPTTGVFAPGVPEPATLALLPASVLALGLRLRCRRS